MSFSERPIFQTWKILRKNVKSGLFSRWFNLKQHVKCMHVLKRHLHINIATPSHEFVLFSETDGNL